MNKENSSGIYQNSDSSVQAYFSYYGKLMHQQNMLSDYMRTSTYHTAISSNPDDFKDKVVLDVGTGTGILAMFSAKAGARKVYAVEASSAVKYAQVLIKHNHLDNTVTLIQKKIEDVEDNDIEPIDVIVSEPLGTMLVNERMIESVIYARDRFLKKSGKIYPAKAALYFMPFSDSRLYNEQAGRAAFWLSNNFFGIDMTALYQSAYVEKLSQPIIDAYDPSFHVNDVSSQYVFDFNTVQLKDLRQFKADFSFRVNRSCTVHGVSSWFDAIFIGANKTISLSTSPYNVPTHWYQTRLLLLYPITVEKGALLIGSIEFISNTEQSYNVTLKIEVKDQEGSYQSNTYNLKEPEFRGVTYNPYSSPYQT